MPILKEFVLFLKLKILQGVTRLLLTKIPFYKDVVIMSFSCEHCGYQNNEIQSGGPVAEKGIRFVLNVDELKDLNRQVVKSDYASVRIPELDFEIPAKSQKGGQNLIFLYRLLDGFIFIRSLFIT